MTDVINAAEKAEMVLHKETIDQVWALFTDHFGSSWSKPRGDKDSEHCKKWARTFYGKYARGDILAGANSLVDQWMDKEIPTVPDMTTFIDHNVQRRVAEERRNPTTPEAVANNKAHKEFRDKWLELCKKIAKSPTSREPSDDDVESFEYSYKNLGLDKKLGPYEPNA